MHVHYFVILQLHNQARCLVKVKLVPLVVAVVEGFLWVEAEASSPDPLVQEGTGFLVPSGLVGHHHISLVSVFIVF